MSAFWLISLLFSLLSLPLVPEVHSAGGATRFRRFLCEFLCIIHSCISAYFNTVFAAYSVNATLALVRGSFARGHFCATLKSFLLSF